MAFCVKCRSIEFEVVDDSNLDDIEQKCGSSTPTHGFQPDDEIYLHSPSLSDLEESATAGPSSYGCIFCSLIHHELKHVADLFGGCDEEGTWRPKDESSPVVFMLLGRDDRAAFRIYCENRAPVFKLVRISEILKRFTSDEYDPTDTTTGSCKSLDLARYWLEKCIGSHPRCARYCTKDRPQLPTRVVDVGARAGGDDVRLFVSQGLRAHYVALSHCWGIAQIVTTTTANLSERQRNIPLSLLSQTFLDAVVSTRALGVRYLWIDSLCIIQDSKEDWDYESASMGNVYRNAICTISAAKSSSGSGGCFAVRDPRLQRPIQLPLKQSIILSPPDAKGWASDAIYVFPSHWSRAVWPLYQRAWVFQEQALSGRSLSFGAKTMYWSCLTSVATESTLMGYDDTDRTMGLKAFQSLSEEEAKQHAAPTSGLWKIWYSMIEDYSRRHLTHDTDRLPAVSAVASQWSRILKDDYAAGLWRSDVLLGLQWSCQGDEGQRCGPPGLYVAPSWSWASMKNATISNFGILRTQQVSGSKYSFGEESYDEEDVCGEEDVCEEDDDDGSCENENSEMEDTDDRTIEVIDIKCTLSGHNRFGQVNKGTIQLIGWVKKATLRLQGQQLFNPESGDVFGPVNFDERPHQYLEKSEIWCLYLRQHQSPTYLEEDTAGITCLALLPTGLVPQECRRLGITGSDQNPWYDGFERMTLTLV
ncbi:HET-domain-containing protein [Lophium mytilinum]|uniref:HET-domain-containing protein n=1 Tax=Lophium mytilinum TaxID=390894 RepID=A0A6A6R1I4_9PEZI|nr:HET-domain-containing protein [Lophium mytilinum]